MSDLIKWPKYDNQKAENVRNEVGMTLYFNKKLKALQFYNSSCDA